MGGWAGLVIGGEFYPELTGQAFEFLIVVVTKIPGHTILSFTLGSWEIVAFVERPSDTAY